MAKHPPKIYLKDYKRASYHITDASLVFDLGADCTDIESELSFMATDAYETGDSLGLDVGNMEIKRIELNGQVLATSDYELREDKLTIKKAPLQGKLILHNTIHPSLNDALEGLYKSGDILCTQNEPEGFRNIIPFVDRPDNMCRFNVLLRADKEKFPVLLSNGNLVDHGELEHGRHYARWEDPFPKPSYLFAIVAGNLACVRDTFKTMSGREVDLLFYVDPGHEGQTEHAIRSLKQAMEWDEKTYGLEYDLDRYMVVAVDSFNMGAMENKGLNIFNSSYVLAHPSSATDQDYLGVQSVIAHEYFHNWTGNRVTCRDWFQLTLKEGLTVFREQQFMQEMLQSETSRVSDVRQLREHQFPEDEGPLAHPIRPESYIEINNFYTATVYEKGAEVVRMLFTLVGQKAFEKGMKLYFELYDGQAVTTEDFVSVMEKASGKDLTQFKQWYSTAGTPEIIAEKHYEKETRTFSVTLKQQVRSQDTVRPTTLHIPLRLSLYSESGEQLLTLGQNNYLLELTQTEQTFSFSDVDMTPVLSLNQGFTAPVKLVVQSSKQDLLTILGSEKDAFNRCEVAQVLYKEHILEVYRDLGKGKGPKKLSSEMVGQLGRVLWEKNLDYALIAELLTLPSERLLAFELSDIDFPMLSEAKKIFARQLAEEFETQLKDVYERLSKENDPLGLSQHSMAQRCLKNLSLEYLRGLDRKEHWDRCYQLFYSAKNMTDELFALKMILLKNDEKANKALHDFYHKWKTNFLVMNKWMGVQASSPSDEVIERIREIEKLPVFQKKNPNNIRSLYGSFARRNCPQFHRADGRGYELVIEKIKELDPINPQVASRLAVNFSQWKKLDQKRQGVIRPLLEDLKSYPQLSKDTYEIIQKYLQD